MNSFVLKFGVFFLLAVAAAVPVRAASLEGLWTGGGYVQPASGQRERVSCRVSYSRRSRSVLGVVATCATTSTKIRQTGELLMVSPTRYVGDFYNAQYDIGGRIRVIVNGTRQTVTFTSGNGGGRLSLQKR